MYISTYSGDIVLYIMRFVGTKYIGKAARICSKFNLLSKEESLWRYYCLENEQILLPWNKYFPFQKKKGI